MQVMATTWLSASEMRAWRNFIESVSILTAAIESDLAPFGLTNGDYEVLVRLSEADDERLRMCDLATVLLLSPSGLTRRLDGLVTSEGTIYPLLARLRRDGLVTTTWQESDAGPPRKYYRLSSAGQRALAGFTDEWTRFRDAVDELLVGGRRPKGGRGEDGGQ